MRSSLIHLLFGEISKEDYNQTRMNECVVQSPRRCIDQVKVVIASTLPAETVIDRTGWLGVRQKDSAKISWTLTNRGAPFGNLAYDLPP